MASKSLLRPLSKSVYYAEAAQKAGNIGAAALSNGTAGDTPAQDDHVPELIVIAAWMDAQLQHAEKYVASYRTLYPSSPILLLRSSQTAFYGLGGDLNRALAPAVDLIRARSATGTAGPESRILVHVFSNGGCMTLKRLNELLTRPMPTAGAGEKQPLLQRDAEQVARRLPARAIVFDSCPGGTSLRITLRAFTAPIRSRWMKLPAMAVLTLIYGATKIWNGLLRQHPTLVRLYNYLNTPGTLPPIPRLYLYSKADLLIPFTDVERHAADAAAQGITVRKEVFEKTPHVAHARAEPERYWRAVTQLWEDSGKR
ncbi:hypothetical protein JCM1841_001315 [Sporobolomyces salmonicolor]